MLRDAPTVVAPTVLQTPTATLRGTIVTKV